MFKLSEYEHLLGERKEEIVDMFKYLCTELNFHKAPASARYHLSKEGGLLEHSENVLKIMLNSNETNQYGLDSESIFLVAIAHDTGKLGIEGCPYYIPNRNLVVSKKQAKYFGWTPAAGDWRKFKKKESPDPDEKYENNPDIIGLPHAVISLSIVSRFLREKLRIEEMQAIIGHNGYFTDIGKEVMHRLNNWHPLTICLHHADVEAATIIEGE